MWRPEERAFTAPARSLPTASRWHAVLQGWCGGGGDGRGAGNGWTIDRADELRERAAFMRAVRWGGAAFALLQFLAYVPPPGVTPPFPMVPAGLACAGSLVIVNLLSQRWSREPDPRRLARFGVVELVADSAVVLAIVGAFAFDQMSSQWALLVFPVLEGAVRGQLGGALATWAGVTGGYVGPELASPRLVGGGLIRASSITYRLGILLVVAIITGNLARNLVLQRRESARRATLLAVVASASRRITTVDPLEVAELVADTAEGLGFPQAVVEAAGAGGEGWTVVRGDEEQVRAWLGDVPALVRRRREMVVVERDDSRLIGCPIWTDGEIGGVLSVRAGGPGPDTRRQPEIEALELLAGQAGAAFSIARRYAERAALEGQLTHHAFHDPLTGLPNRTLFRERLEHALARSGRDQGVLAVLFLDLDGFKTVNDSLGHEVGDELLVAVATRLRAGLRPGDTAARLGGDEFTVLLEQLSSPDDGLLVADRILQQVREPFRLAGRELHVSVSIGMAVSPDGERSPAELLRQADLAMYQAKETGRNRVASYRPDLDATAMYRLELQTELHRALERDEFSLRYQPIVELAGGKIMGLEALVRWEHPTRGSLVPAEFVPLARETGLIIPLGRWVLERACTEVRAWQTQYPSATPLRLSVNLSAEQFRHVDLGEQLRAVLARTGLEPCSLTLEITEGALHADPETLRRSVGDLQRVGVQIAIDDFGRGESSLGYLRRLPLGMLKIDKSFVDGLTEEGLDGAIVGSVVALARALGIRSVAEGVEQDGQLERLRALGCDLAQGYVLYRPVPGDEVAALLAETVRPGGG